MTLIRVRLIVIVACTVVSAWNAEASWERLDIQPVYNGPSASKASAEFSVPEDFVLADLDSNGARDLCAGFATSEGGAVVVFRGNPLFRQGLRRETWREAQGLAPVLPFDESAVVHLLPTAPHFIAVGRVNGDAHEDLIVASRDEPELLILHGDGTGRLAAPVSLTLPGPPTALAVGDVDRADGMDDIVVGISVGLGGGLLVYEHPEGADKAEPEWYPTEAPVVDVALARLDRDPWVDIVAAAGDVVLVFGRDRKLTSTMRRRDAVASASVRTIAVGAQVAAVEVGGFVDSGSRQVLAVGNDGSISLLDTTHPDDVSVRLLEAELSVRDGLGITAAATSGTATHELVVTDERGDLRVFGTHEVDGQLTIVTSPGSLLSATGRTRAARLNRDARDDVVSFDERGQITVAASAPLATFEVNTISDADDGTCNVSHCSLREAINALNAAGSGSAIVIDLGLGSVVAVGSQLPSVTASGATLDGTIGSGMLASKLQLDGSGCGTGCNGLTISGGTTEVTDFVIGGFGGSTRAAASVFSGVAVSLLSSSNIVERCLLGIDFNSLAAPNKYGVVVEKKGYNTIGATGTGDGNVISGNLNSGVILWAEDVAAVDPYADGNRIVGNLIGTNRYGTGAVANGGNGVSIQIIGANEVGDFNSYEQNVVAGNGHYGISLWRPTGDDAGAAVIVRNLIDCASDGSTPLPNADGGIKVSGQRNTTIGGTIPGLRNVLVGAGQEVAIEIIGESEGSIVQGNYVSLGSDGLSARPYTVGIQVSSDDVTIGGIASGAGNVIGGNVNYGINIGSSMLDPEGVDVLGNVVGTDAAENNVMQNGLAAIRVKNAQQCMIGDPFEPDSGNVIVGTAYQAPGLWIVQSDRISVAQNLIGVRTSGDAMPNGSHGILIEDTQDSSVTSGNVIAHNTHSGIAVIGSSREIFMPGASSIHSNTLRGIDLGGDGVTFNDTGDGDTGPNDLLNFPVITGYDFDTMTLSGTLDTDRPSETMALYVYLSAKCDSSGHGEAENYLASRLITTDASGDSVFSVVIPVPANRFVTTVVSDEDSNTSEFSRCFWVEEDSIFADGFETGNTSEWSDET